MIADRQDNSGLYFIVGALLVAVAAVGIFYFATGKPDADRMASGDTTVIERITPAAGDEASNKGASSSMSLSVDEDGVSATSESTETQ